MIMNKDNEKNKSNKTSFDVFIDTITELAESQGFYSRIYDRMAEMSLDELEDMKVAINAQYNFKEPVDVIMALEG